MNNVANIRPSNLPKLAECPNYQPKKDAGPAAARGNMLDTVFRDWMQGRTEFSFDLSQEDLDVVFWAVRKLKSLSFGATDILTDEAQCRLAIPGIERPGTADCIVPSLRFSADLKSGSIRNYREQMAAYALACMEKYFEDEWTTYLLFCDQKEVAELHFTYPEAKAIVDAVIDAASQDNPPPKECAYCSWCDRQATCPAVPKADLAVINTNAAFLEVILSDAAKLGEFLTNCALLDDLREQAEDRAKELLAKNPNSVPGWKLKKGGERSEVDHVQIGKYLSRLGSGPLLAAIGSISAKKFRDVWEKQLPSDPFPEDAVTKKSAGKPSLIKA